MDFRHTVSLFAMFLSINVNADTKQKELVDYIDPIIGCWASKEGRSHGLGKTFPGPVAPFGLVQLSPDTVTGGDYGPGYCYAHKTIEGFSFNHLSGIGAYGDLGNLQTMPTTGELQVLRTLDQKSKKGKGPQISSYAAKSEYSHEEEVTKAGYYSVNLKRYGIKTELTAAPRAGMIRFTYPKSDTSRIQIDLGRRIGMKDPVNDYSTQHIEVVDDYAIKGYMKCSSKDGGWRGGNGAVNYTLYFYAEFTTPIKEFGVWDNEEIMPGVRSYTGKNVGFYFEFPTDEGEQVLMKSGISYARLEGAKANLEHDIPDWDFEKVYQKTRSLWSDALSGVAVEGGNDEQKTVFATCLYHSFIDPRVASDIDGYYTGADGQSHIADGFKYRTIFSGWDVYRSQFPLLTILRPDVVNDEINSLIQIAELSGKGYLPRWELLNAYTRCMHADVAVNVFAEAYLKGIRNYDIEKAYKACYASVLKVTGKGGNRKPFYLENGYVPKAMSLTLEYAFNDYSAAMFAQALGKDDAKKLFEMSQNYHKIYDPSVNNMRAKYDTGEWVKWKGLLEGGENGTRESNPYQQHWFVPHDVQGLINIMGGDETFLNHLIPFFEKADGQFTGWNLYYNHANEPVHHVAYLFPYAGAPWLTQKWARIIMDKAYSVGVRGLCGNEDVGQMSAWYLLSAMGFHPVDTTTPYYIIGSPIFDKVTLRLDPEYHQGDNLEIIAENNSPENVYVQSLTLNGNTLNRAWIKHEEITGGGVLKFVMGPEPNKEWGSSAEARPPSMSPPLERFSQ